jgi:hypothetical protein
MEYSKLMMRDLINLSLNEAEEKHTSNYTEENFTAIINDASLRFIDYIKESYNLIKLEQAFNEELTLYNEIKNIFGKAFSLLRIFIGLNRSAGNSILRSYEFEEESDKRNKIMFVFRFHGMLLKNAEAISILLQNGFSNEALGRWRTMHEISAVMLTLVKQNAVTIKMYQDHGMIEKFHEMEEFQKNHHLLNLKPFKDEDFKNAEIAKAELINKYGKSFSKSYGWAINIVKKGQIPNFRAIEQIAKLDYMRPFYIHAGQSIHAGMDGIASYINDFSHKDFFKMSKPSSFGISQPANFCCWTLITTTSHCLDLKHEPEFAVFKKSLSVIYEETCSAFKIAGNKLDKEKYGQKDYFDS